VLANNIKLPLDDVEEIKAMEELLENEPAAREQLLIMTNV
jgi:hypothetical protein